jgi:hypothetical protein
VDARILPHLDNHMGAIFEEMSREHARSLAASNLLTSSRVDAWWSPDGEHEIDLVGVVGKKSVGFVGSVKWSARKLGSNALENLKHHAESLPGYTAAIPHLLYGRSGCTTAIRSLPAVRCFSARDMYRRS